MFSRCFSNQIYSKQQGAALAMALIFLLLLTIIGVSAISTTTLEEKMSGNILDRNLAFQSAETALRDGEQHVRTVITDSSVFTAACTSGLCIPATATSGGSNPHVWTAVVDWGSGSTTSIKYGTSSGETNLSGLSNQPRYIIEKLPAALVAGTASSSKCGAASDYSSTGSCVSGGGQYYRITARGTGRTGAVVVLQSVYRK